MIFKERLSTTSGGGGACSVATVTEFMVFTTASYLHQLTGLPGHTEMGGDRELAVGKGKGRYTS